MKPQLQTLFSDYSGDFKDLDQKSKEEEEYRWKVKTEKQGKTEEDESQPLINLGLGIGGPSFCNTRSDNLEKDSNFTRRLVTVEEDDHDQVVEKEECRICSVVRFTEDQLEELKRQFLIFKYIVWGLPIPLQLLLPILRSFSSSPSPSSFPLHLNLTKGSSPLLIAVFRGGFDYQQMMDAAPGRCRRTDGKKWRCHQSVVPNEKYCEKHMHRGSKRSRKLVEASPNSGPPNLISLNQNKNPSCNIRPEFPENLSQHGPNKVVVRVPSLTNTTEKSNENGKQNNEAKRGTLANERIPVLNLSSGLDFSSPKSVLQNDMRCARLENCKNNPESESRCKRTDGKKWRCKREVLPDQKYCAQHINRGKIRSQKPSLGSLSASISEAQAAYGSTSSAKFCRTEQGKVCLQLGPDTNLKISLPRMMINPSPSYSSEATESDESTGVSDIIVLSP